MSTTFLKKYKVVSQIGEGSFSEVLRCQDRESGNVFAAKRLKKTYNCLEEVTECPEVIAMRKLSQHPNILQVIEFHVDPFPGRVTFIFELMEMSIYEMLKHRKRPLPEVRVKRYLHQILRGLDHLHHHGIFHRDIKPENILIKNEIVKLADLGSIRGAFSKPPYTEYISTRWYRSPECLLTIGYYGPKMDVWACGCVFYELLTTKPLFPGTNEVDQIAKIHNVLGTPHARLLAKFHRHKSRNCDYFFQSRAGSGLKSLVSGLSEKGRDVMKQMLIYDPEQRSNVRRLLEHKYFYDLREQEVDMLKKLEKSSKTIKSLTEWRNPLLLSYITSKDKKKQTKQQATEKETVSTGTITAGKLYATSSNVKTLPPLKSVDKNNNKMTGPLPSKTLENVCQKKIETKTFYSEEQLRLKQSWENIDEVPSGVRTIRKDEPKSARDVSQNGNKTKVPVTLCNLPSYSKSRQNTNLNFGSVTLPNIGVRKSNPMSMTRINLVSKQSGTGGYKNTTRSPRLQTINEKSTPQKQKNK